MCRRDLVVCALGMDLQIPRTERIVGVRSWRTFWPSHPGCENGGGWRKHPKLRMGGEHEIICLSCLQGKIHNFFFPRAPLIVSAITEFLFFFPLYVHDTMPAPTALRQPAEATGFPSANSPGECYACRGLSYPANR